MRTQRGAVMVVTLGVLAALVSIVSVIAANQRVAIKAQINRGQAARARLAAEAGIQRGLAELQAYLDSGQTSYASLADAWAILGGNGSEYFSLGRDSFRIQIVDASGLINLNTAPQEHLERLPLTTEQIDSLLDWRSPELEPRPEGGKDEYYNSLPTPYNAKLRRFESVDELLLVKGFTPQTVYEPQENVRNDVVLAPTPNGEQPSLDDLLGTDSSSANTAADGQTKLNVNTANAQQMIQRGIAPNVAQAIVQRRNTQGTFARMGDVLRLPAINQGNAPAVVDNLWISGAATVQGRINLNTASEAVLSSLPGMQPDVAAAIAGRQTTGMQALSEVLSVPGITVQTLQENIDFIGVGTSTFLIRCIGIAGDARVALSATVTIQNNSLRVLKVETMSFPDMWRRWGWEQEPTTEIILAEEQ